MGEMRNAHIVLIGNLKGRDHLGDIGLNEMDVRFDGQNCVILQVVLYGCETWPLTLRKKHRLRVSKNRVLRKIRRGIQKIPDRIDNEIYAYNNKHSLRSNTRVMAA
jgi:hypothetical protein